MRAMRVMRVMRIMRLIMRKYTIFNPFYDTL